MTPTLAPEDRKVLHQLLTNLYRRLNGLLDTGTGLCLAPGDSTIPSPEFIAKQAEVLRSLAVVIESLAAGDASCVGVAKKLVRSVREFDCALAILASSKALAPEQLRGATNSVADAYRCSLRLIAELGVVLGSEDAPWAKRTAEQEAYYEGILRRLYDLFIQARDESKNQPALT